MLLKKTKKTFHNIFSSKRALFAVFLAVLVLGFSAKASLAATYNINQKHDLKNTFGLSEEQITNLQNSNVTFENFTKKINDTLASPTYKDKDTTSAASISAAASSVYDARPRTQTEIEQIKDWDNWTLGKEPPPGTKVMTITSGVDDGKPATYQLISSDQRTIEHSVVVPAAQAVEKAVGATGNYIGGKINDIAIQVVITVLTVIAGFCKLLLMFAGWTLDATLDPNLYNFTNNTMIVQGWTAVRDICNLFFLLVLLFIAICTILKIEKYHAKKTLLMLIIMALLINFSKPIAIFIFDGSQLLMNFFLSQMGKDPSTKFVTTLSDLIYTDLMTTLKNMGESSWKIAIQYLFVVVFLFMFAVAMFVTALMLIVRIVVIMILIIVSPLAFFSAIIPDFSKMSSSWWSALFEYSYYGPAAAFFLYLGTNFALGNVLPRLNSPNESSIINTLIKYFTTLVFLYASIFMAKKFGGGAGAAIVGNANRFMKWAGKGAAMAPYRATAWGTAASGVTGGVKQAIGASRFGKYLTKKGRKDAQEEREANMAERFGVEGAARKHQLKKSAEMSKKWKDEGILDDEEELRNLSRTGSPLQRMTASREMAKAKKIKDASEFNLLRNQITDPTFRKIFEGDVKKNMPNIYFRHLMDNEGYSSNKAFEEISAGQSFEEFLKNTRAPSLKADKDLYNQFAIHWSSLSTEAQQGALTRIPAPMVKFLKDESLI